MSKIAKMNFLKTEIRHEIHYSLGMNPTKFKWNSERN